MMWRKSPRLPRLKKKDKFENTAHEEVIESVLEGTRRIRRQGDKGPLTSTVSYLYLMIYSLICYITEYLAILDIREPLSREVARNLRQLRKKLREILNRHGPKRILLHLMEKVVAQMSHLIYRDEKTPEQTEKEVDKFLSRCESACYPGKDGDTFRRFLSGIRRLFSTHKSGLFACRFLPLIPSTNNQIERCFRIVKRCIRRWHGTRATARYLHAHGRNMMMILLNIDLSSPDLSFSSASRPNVSRSSNTLSSSYRVHCSHSINRLRRVTGRLPCHRKAKS